MEIRTNAESRKDTVKALSEHFGIKAVYLGPPTFAYKIGRVKIGRDGVIDLLDDSMEEEVIRVLQNAGLCGGTPPDVPEETHTEVSVPMAGMTAQGMINLIRMLHAKQYLLNRATGNGKFKIEDDLLEKLEGQTFADAESAALFLKDYLDEDCGIRLEDDKIIFTGFPPAGDMIPYCALAAAMVRIAKEKKRISPKVTIVENEKYYMRAWLVSLGFGGIDGKQVRNYFLKDLKGHTAFRTPADEEKWKENRRKEKEVVGDEISE